MQSASILCKAFTTYVRPMVGYCSPVWSTVAVTLINQLESIQRRFTNRLPGFQTLPYDERCALLGLDRLELRRLRAAMGAPRKGQGRSPDPPGFRHKFSHIITLAPRVEIQMHF